MGFNSFARFAGLAAVTSALLFGGSSGCSVYMAANQPAKKNVSVLNPGTPRPLVIAELGAPIHSEKRDGKTIDLFSFTQGYSGGLKAGRAAFHLAADVFTAGLWEVVATPGEAIFSGTDVKLQVTYDPSEQVENVRPFEGAGELDTPNVSSTQAPVTPPAASAAPTFQPASYVPVASADSTLPPAPVAAPHGLEPAADPPSTSAAIATVAAPTVEPAGDAPMRFAWVKETDCRQHVTLSRITGSGGSVSGQVKVTGSSPIRNVSVCSGDHCEPLADVGVMSEGTTNSFSLASASPRPGQVVVRCDALGAAR